MNTLGLGAMPPLAKNAIDTQATELIEAWVDVLNDPAVDFLGEYYQGENFETFVLQRDDAVIDFMWGTGSPDPSIGANDFSVRWTGSIQAVASLSLIHI